MGWVTLIVNFRWKGTSPPTIICVRKLECFGYLTVKTAGSYLYSSGYSTYQQVTDRQLCRGYYTLSTIMLSCVKTVTAVKLVVTVTAAVEVKYY